MDFIQAAVGLTLLFAAGDLLVRGAVSAGVKLRIPAVLVGLTIVAFGTSAPELFVTIQASIQGAPGIALGNVIGSNIANVLLVVGLPALLAPMGDDSSETRRNYVIMMLVTVVTVLLCFNAPLTWWQGALLLSLLAMFLFDTYRSAMVARAKGDLSAGTPDEMEDADPDMPAWKVIGLLAIGVIGLPIAAQMTVGAAKNIASAYDISNEAIGLTMIALGTSLPELATTVMAAVRRRADVAIGNVIGSNVFNLLCILGVAASLDDIPVPDEFLSLNLWIMVGAALALAPFVLTKLKVGRLAGGVFVSAYVAYILVVLLPLERL